MYPLSGRKGKVNAPDFPSGLEWLNTEKPLSLKALKGKAVLLDFWTYCCINCMHVIPDLKRLEVKYARELVVIGVHSGKFSNEKDTGSIRQAVLRYQIDHPVVNDKDFRIWRSYGVRAWPTAVLIDPQGNVVGSRSGENLFENFDEPISALISEFSSQGLLSLQPLSFKTEKEGERHTVLSFPGKIASAGDRLFISDSNHNRILFCGLDGKVQDMAGDGVEGMDDGGFDEARFFRPQGLCVNAEGDKLYVADTENHSVRVLDLESRTVDTIAGTGLPGLGLARPGTGPRKALNSPWDLAFAENMIFIAMAGPHQIWKLDPDTGDARVHAGSGYEDIVDGPLAECALAQPSSICWDGKHLYFVDSETSSIRRADIELTGKVSTLIGAGLFEFGDLDGSHPRARLQHPLGIACHQGMLYVADTYNHKIKRLDPGRGSVETFIGTGKRGFRDGSRSQAMLDEPGGLCFADGKMFIADTNNHLVRTCDMETGEVGTISLGLLMKPFVSISARQAVARERLEVQRIAPGARTLEIRLELPSGFKFTPDSPFSLEVRSNRPDILGIAGDPPPAAVEKLDLPLSARIGDAEVLLDAEVYYCDEEVGNLCYYRNFHMTLPVAVADGAPDQLHINCRI